MYYTITNLNGGIVLTGATRRQTIDFLNSNPYNEYRILYDSNNVHSGVFFNLK